MPHEVVDPDHRHCFQRIRKHIGQAGDDAASKISEPERPNGRIKQLAILVGLDTIRYFIPALRHCVNALAAECGASGAHIWSRSRRGIVFLADIS